MTKYLSTPISFSPIVVSTWMRFHLYFNLNETTHRLRRAVYNTAYLVSQMNNSMRTVKERRENSFSWFRILPHKLMVVESRIT